MSLDGAALAIMIIVRKIAMETKVCTKCKRELPIDDFNWRDKKRGTRRSECKYCHTEHMRNAYDTKKNFISEIKSQISCQKCGENKEYVLDFHHIDRKNKENTIARMTSNYYNLNRIMEEIEKCIVLCANCHREFHYLEENCGITLESYLNGDYDI